MLPGLDFWAMVGDSPQPMLKRFRSEGRPSAERARIGATVAERLGDNPRARPLPGEGLEAYCVENFLDARACQMLIDRIDAGRRPSTLLSDAPEENFRTSDSCDLNRWDEAILPIDTAIADLLGIDVAHGETIQGQRYAPGQFFRAHHDYFFESQGYWDRVKKDGGQRTWTAMVYLNDVAEGGATWFPQAGARVLPKRGLLLAWNNMAADGRPNKMTLHEGTAVTRGVKYIITKWFREARWLPNY